MKIINEHLLTKTDADCPKFVSHLLRMDSRIRTYSVIGSITEDDETGFFITKDYICIPVGLPTIQHEVGHMVEMNNEKRLLQPDFGMKLYGNWKTKKGNSIIAGFIREVRVRAIQHHIHCSNDFHDIKSADCMLKHIIWSEMAKRSLPIGRFKSWEDFSIYIQETYERTFNAWSLDRIEATWIKHLKIMQDHMENLN